MKSIHFLLVIVVAIVCGIVAVDVFAFFAVCLPKLAEISVLNAVVMTALFLLSIFMLLWSYYRAVTTSSLVRDHKIPESLRNVRFPACKRCDSVKPMRAHHCSWCGTCVLKMDHHCPWVANCVGMHNYKYFCLFLFWTVVACAMFTISLAPVVASFSVKTRSVLPVLVLFPGMITLSFGVTLIGFGGFHLQLVFGNRTTLESWKRGEKSPFDLGGRRANFESVFGNNPWLWLIPVRTHLGSGFDFHKIQLRNCRKNHRSPRSDQADMPLLPPTPRRSTPTSRTWQSTNNGLSSGSSVAVAVEQHPARGNVKPMHSGHHTLGTSDGSGNSGACTLQSPASPSSEMKRRSRSTSTSVAHKTLAAKLTRNVGDAFTDVNLSTGVQSAPPIRAGLASTIRVV